jgi:hypothetical protein
VTEDPGELVGNFTASETIKVDPLRTWLPAQFGNEWQDVAA